jgi:D-sedoheptulose 7-phosphate isomerase
MFVKNFSGGWLHQRLGRADCRSLCELAATRRSDSFTGNGGTAVDAQHLAGELVSRFNYDRQVLAGIAPRTDSSALTAIGDDYAYDQVFATVRRDFDRGPSA